MENFINEKGQVYFKLMVNRNLQGITINDDTINNNLLRYIEINLNAIDNDLKIASIYTTLPNKKHEMAYWWNNMADSWKDYFGQGILVYDTLPFTNIISFNDSSLVCPKWFEQIKSDTFYIDQGDTLAYSAIMDSLSIKNDIFIEYDTSYAKLPDTIKVDTKPIYSQLKRLWKRTKLDISNSILIGNLNPLSELSELVEINISNTLIDDLTPLRNLNKLENLNLSGTPVYDISALRYSSNIILLDLSKTAISDLSILPNLHKLEYLDLSYTNISNLDEITRLSNLNYLNLTAVNLDDNLSGFENLTSLNKIVLASTNINKLNFLSDVTSLNTINIDSTMVSDLSSLSGLENLSVLQANNTPVFKLKPLLNLKNLTLIYCDNSKVNREEALSFIDKKPECTVIYNTNELLTWWESLSDNWQSIAHYRMKLSTPVTKEQLHQIISIESVNLSGNRAIKSLKPLRMLYRLEELDVSSCQIDDLSPLSGLNNLKYININNTNVSSLEGLENLQNLEFLYCENTNISDIMPLINCKNLEVIYADNAQLRTEAVLDFKQKSDCNVVYQTEKLQMWWNNLPVYWHKILQENLNIETEPGREQLQEMVDLKNLQVKGNIDIKSLEVLSLFNLLEDIEISNTRLSDISAISFLPSVKKLSIPNNPVYDISSISKMTQLQELNMENTSVDDLEALEGLTQLRSLNIAGTKVSNLKDIQNLTNLRVLIINNTSIRNLKHIENINLEELKCYNTRLKSSKIEDYKALHPDCEVVYY
ncbi:MAG: hypothetical protein C0598_03860 [Marinilabiliales bacterium]|nr:MAG: hypothetical protein C0598_03860 [Marinilabiliales bacterium]